MWRSRARIFLLRSSRQSSSCCPIQNQVLLSKTLAHSPPPDRPKWAFSSRTGFPTTRFFSASAARSGHEAGEEDGEKLGFSEANGFGEDWSSDPRESENLSSIFEDGVDVKEGFGDSPLVFDEGTVEDGPFVEDSDLVSPASNAHSEVLEDSVGEAEEEVEDVLAEIDAEKLENVLAVLQSAVEETLEKRLDELDLALSEEIFTRVLENPLVQGESLIRFFTWAFKRPDFVKSSAVLELFVQKVCRSREMVRKEAFMLWDLVRGIGEKEKGLLNAEILNHFISVFSKLGKAKAVMEVFNKFDELACVPDGNTYCLTILALGKRTWSGTAWAVCEKMLASKSLPDSEKIGKIIKFFCRGGKEKDAHLIYLTAKENGKCPPPSYLGFLVDHLSRKDDTLPKALELLEEFSGESENQSSGPFISTISGLCRIKDTETAKKLLDRMINSGPLPSKAVFNSLITALSKAGEMDDAVALLKVMESRGLRPDIRVYNVIMSGFARGGLMDEARKIFSEAKKEHQKLGRVSYHILTQGYSRIDEFENALKCMTEMKEEGIQPNVDEYRKMVQSLCLKALDWRTAEKLLEEMKENGLQLDGHTCGLIAAVKVLEKEEMRSAGLTAEA